MLPVDAASTSRKPIIGPVQENYTSVRVRAMKNIPPKPPDIARRPVPVLQLAGRVKSNNPNRASAKTTRIRKKAMLTMELVASELRALAPKIRVMVNASVTYTMIMENPYRTASLISDFLSLDLFMKKLTVIGIIGHTQGVSRAIRPPKKLVKKSLVRPIPFVDTPFPEL